MPQIFLYTENTEERNPDENITIKELVKAIARSKTGKASRADKIDSEMVKSMGKEGKE